MFRDVGERHPDAPLRRPAEVGERRIAGIEHPRHAGQRLAVEPGRVGQIGGRFVVERDRGAEIDGRGRHRFVLAELPVGREQVVELQPVKDFRVAGGLRVGQRRGNEVVEIEAVNAERPAQMGAAGLQQRHHFAAVADRIEIRLHVAGPREHLAQRQRDGEQFREDRFHGIPTCGTGASGPAQADQEPCGSHFRDQTKPAPHPPLLTELARHD